MTAGQRGGSWCQGRHAGWGNRPVEVAHRTTDPQQVLHQKARVGGESWMQGLGQRESRRRSKKTWAYSGRRKCIREHHCSVWMGNGKVIVKSPFSLNEFPLAYRIQVERLTVLFWPFPLEEGFYSGPLRKPFRNWQPNNEVQQSSRREFLSGEIQCLLIGPNKQFMIGLDFISKD